jgi:hypothetical protein
MTEIEVLQLALTKEESAIKIYQEMSISHLALIELLFFWSPKSKNTKK